MKHPAARDADDALRTAETALRLAAAADPEPGAAQYSASAEIVAVLRSCLGATLHDAGAELQDEIARRWGALAKKIQREPDRIRCDVLQALIERGQHMTHVGGWVYAAAHLYIALPLSLPWVCVPDPGISQRGFLALLSRPLAADLKLLDDDDLFSPEKMKWYAQLPLVTRGAAIVDLHDQARKILIELLVVVHQRDRGKVLGWLRRV